VIFNFDKIVNPLSANVVHARHPFVVAVAPRTGRILKMA